MRKDCANAHKKGFSLAEVMIAMMVIVVGISGVTHVLWWGKQNERGGSLMTEATNHARTLMETIIGQGLIAGNSWPGAGSGLFDSSNDRSPVFAPPLAGGAANLSSSNLDGFTRNVRCERLSDLNGTSGSSEESLALVVVRVYWQEQGENSSKPHERHVELRTVVEHSVGGSGGP